MSDKQHDNEDELFFDQLKDQFVFFYAVTITAMEAVKELRARALKKHTDSQEESKQ